MIKTPTLFTGADENDVDLALLGWVIVILLIVLLGAASGSFLAVFFHH